MADTMTIGKIADLFERKYADFSSGYYARQLRHHVQLGIFAPYARTGEGRTAAAQFRFDEVAMIRLVSILARLGLSTDLLADANKCHGNILDEDAPGEGGLVGIHHVLAGVRNGEEWFFHFHVATIAENGEPTAGRGFGGFSQSRDVSPPKLIADHIMGTIVLPCLPLLTPLVTED